MRDQLTPLPPQAGTINTTTLSNTALIPRVIKGSTTRRGSKWGGMRSHTMGLTHFNANSRILANVARINSNLTRINAVKVSQDDIMLLTEGEDSRDGLEVLFSPI